MTDLTRQNHLLDLAIARDIDQVEVPGKVGLKISARILDQIAHARMRPQAHDPVGYFVRQCHVKRDIVGEIDLLEGERIAVLGQQPQTVAFDPRAVTIVDAVNPEHRIAAGEKA